MLVAEVGRQKPMAKIQVRSDAGSEQDVSSGTYTRYSGKSFRTESLNHPDKLKRRFCIEQVEA